MTDTEIIADVVVKAVKAATAPILERVDALQARQDARGPDLSSDEIASALTDLLRKDLALEPLRMQRRIVRNAKGEIEKLVEEPVA